ncbi:MAG: hypothetical protein F6K36_07190 [Symploca sp. SIO3C6]|nr:hypothetical protein [Symploca sp. SIO3C6]NET04007.1 hypothetical protein [Symploca sp. SIO2B6]
MKLLPLTTSIKDLQIKNIQSSRGRWGDGEMGRWGDGEMNLYLVFLSELEN